MQFLVEIKSIQSLTDEMMALIPAETTRGNELDAAGSRLALYIAADFSAAWQVYQAESLAEVQEMIDSFPLTRFVTPTITPLQAATT
ncbi:MAG: muconolactone Delta-isomerase family protein [Roseiflexaceae bacterium]